MGYRCADTLIDKLRAAIEHGADELVGIANEDRVGLVPEFLKENVNHGQHAQHAQVVVDVTQEVGAEFVLEIGRHEAQHVIDGAVVGKSTFLELLAYLIPVGSQERVGHGGLSFLFKPRGKRLLAIQALAERCQQPIQFLGHRRKRVLTRLLRLTDKLLKGTNGREVTVKHAIVIGRAQITAYVLYPAAKGFGVDLLGEVGQGARIVKEAPLFFTVATMQQMPLIFLDPLVDLGRLAGAAEREQEVVYRHTDGIVLLELDIVVEVTVQLPREVAQNRLEERVDSAHIEVAVVKQQLVQCLMGQRPHLLLLQTCLTDETLKIITLDAWLRESIQLLDNAVLHLVGSFVGKGDGQQQAVSIQDAVVALGPPRMQLACLVAGKQQVFDVLLGQVIGFSRASRGLHDQHVAVIVVHRFVHDSIR